MPSPTFRLPPRSPRSSPRPPGAGLLLLLGAGLLLLAPPAHAATGWRGVEPGVTTREEVLSRFEEPSRVHKLQDKEVLVYRDGRRIKGTARVQLRILRETGRVERVEVFPDAVIDRDAVESTYGPACPPGTLGARCYVSKLTEDNRTYFFYALQGVAVFFRPNGRTVHAFVYTVPSGARPAALAQEGGGEPSGAGGQTHTAQGEGGEGEAQTVLASGEGAGAQEGGGAEAASSDASTLASMMEEVDVSALADKLQIGGMVFLQGEGTVGQSPELEPLGLQAPMLLDLYLDGRPNDRVRGMMVSRLVYEPTLREGFTTGDASLNGAAVPVGSNPALMLDQLWVKFDVARRLYVTVGRQHAKWGTSHIWNTVDFLMPVRRNPLAVFDSRLGADMVKLHLPVGEEANLYAVGFLNTSGPTEAPLRMGGALRAEAVLGEAELALSARFEQGGKPQYGFDFSSALGFLDVRGEVVVRRDADRRLWRRVDAPLQGAGPEGLFAQVQPDGLLWATSFGVDWSHNFSEESSLSLSAEGYYNPLGYEDPSVLGWLMAQGDYRPFYAGRLYAGLIAAYSQGGREPFSLTLMALSNLADRSGLVRPGLQWTVLNDLTLNLYSTLFFGRGEFRSGGPTWVPLPEGQGWAEVQQPRPLFNLGMGLSIRI